MFKYLDAQKIVETSIMLRKQIEEQFSNSGLKNVTEELVDIAVESIKSSKKTNNPILWVRITSYFLILNLFVVLIGILFRLDIHLLIENFYHSSYDLSNFLQGTESGLSSIIIIATGIFFLTTVETRIKRKKVISLINELRAIAHVIDAHHLTKDPFQLESYGMSQIEMFHYLNSCSNMLSILGKIAALHVQKFRDAETLNAVDDIQDLINGLSNKIWHKIALLELNVKRI